MAIATAGKAFFPLTAYLK